MSSEEMSVHRFGRPDEKRFDLLDHGYIELVDKWGADEAIISAARMSTARGFEGWGPLTCSSCEGAGTKDGKVVDYVETEDSCPKCKGLGQVDGDEKLLRYLWKHKHCYDEETEVLTDRGFVRWPAVVDGDRLAQWDKTISSLVYEKPRELIKRRHRGRMYRVDHGGVDLLVTDNHKMLVKRIVGVPGENRQEWSKGWSLVSAADLGHASMVRYRKHARYGVADDVDLRSGEKAPTFPEHADTRSLLRLIGFFIGDGHAGGSYANAITFHLRRKRKIAYLRDVCLEVGWELDEMASDIYVVRAEGLTRFFRAHFYDESGAKQLPRYLVDVNAHDAEALLDGLRASDGSIKRGAWEYTSTSRQVAEAVQILVLHAGGAAHVHHGECISRVMVLSRMLEPVVNQGKRQTSWVEDFDGDVYCAHTRTGVLVVRRNGKIVLSGNSTPFEMAGITIEVQAPIFLFREWHRHRVPFGYSEASARYAPLPVIDYLPTIDRIKRGGGHQTKQAGREAELAPDGVLDEDIILLADYYERGAELQRRFLSHGWPKELARITNTVGRYSKMRATGNLRGWLALLSLRMEKTAQWEFQEYSGTIGREIIARAFPRTWSLFAEGLS